MTLATAILACGVLALMVAGHLAFRPSPFWRSIVEVVVAVCLVAAGLSLIRLHDRATSADDEPAAKRWERAV